MALEDQYFFNCFECGKEDFQGSILDFHRHLSTHQSSEENSQKNDLDSDQMPPMVLVNSTFVFYRFLNLVHLLYSSTSAMQCLEISRMQNLEISRICILEISKGIFKMSL